MIFVQSLAGWVACLVFFGMALGNQWFMDPPTMADVLDDVAVRTGRRDPAVYFGYQSFIFKLGQTSIAAVIAVVHEMTGFVSGAPSLDELVKRSPTPELALFGIRVHAAIVPAVVVLAATLVFWKLYDLTPEKVAANRAKLEERGI
jgi:Na+/melibiose symporter-like transporter